MTIFVQSPTSNATGGTELLQQFASIGRAAGYDCQMLYTQPYEGSAVQKKFSFYENPKADTFEDSVDNAVIVPEVEIHTLSNVKHAKRAIWWESVDNYQGALFHGIALTPQRIRWFLGRTLYIPRHFRNLKVIRSCTNFVQSEYARVYLSDELGVSPDHIVNLSDYIDQRYRVENVTSLNRKDRVLYNPKKGIEFTKRLMKQSPELKWTPLRGYTLSEMIELFQTSKVYVDFGNHPGKDRMPREAASAGCCVVTGSRGAAANEVDVPISSKYKFDSSSQADRICALIKDCLERFDEHSPDFAAYRESIRSEKDVFESEVKNACVILTRNEEL